MRFNKKSPLKSDKKNPPKAQKKGVVGYNKKTALLEEAITHMNEGKYGRSSAALKELLALDPLNTEARRLFATLHLRLGSLISARTAFESLAREALERQDFWLAESLLREYLTAGPRCVPFLDMLGQVYEQKGDSMAAVAEYGKAIEVLTEDPDPDHPDRAADLFAKIRSLAAGSPEAFRFAPLFNSATGQLLSPPPVSNPNPAMEDSQQAAEPVSNPGDSSSILPEPPQPPPDHTAEPAAPADSSEQTDHGAPAMAIDTVCPATTENQGTEGREGSGDEKQVSAVQQWDDVQPPVPPVSELLDEAADPPLKLAAEAATMPADAMAPGVETTALLVDTTAVSFEREPGFQAVEDPIAVPDLSLHEVTQPIMSEAPSAPVPMPWDQVQDTTLSIPLPSVESEAAQVLGAVDAHHTEDLSSPEPVGTADDHPTLPVQPESLLSSMSWEEILEAVGKGPEPRQEVEHTTASIAFHEQADATPSYSDQRAFDSKNSVLSPISEPVVEAPALPVPMPWEQVEEESVPIPQHEPEPEFGVVSESPLTSVIDDAVAPHSEDTKAEAHDPTLVLNEAPAIPLAEHEQASLASSPPLALQEPVLEHSADPPVEQPIDQADLVPLVGDETPVSPPIPSEPAVLDLSPVESTADRISPSDIADAVANVADPFSAPKPAEPLDMETESEPVSSEPKLVESEAAAERSEPPYDATVHLGITNPDPRPAPRESLVAASSPPAPSAALLEPVSPSGIIDTPPPHAAHEAAPGEIKILWDESSSQPMPEVATTGLLSRWLRRPKQDEPPESTPSDRPVPDVAPAGPERTERFAPEVTIPAIAASDLLREQSAFSLPASSDQKPALVKIRKPLVDSLSDRVRSGAGRLIDTCFSTTRSVIVSLMLLVSAIIALGVGGLGVAGLTWVLMEERPNTAFHNLNAAPRRTLQDASTNGYLTLLGFDRATTQDAAQAGFARTLEQSDLAMANACLMNSRERRGGERSDTERTVAGWYQEVDPAARFRAQAGALRAWTSQADRSIARYKQWLTMPFDDWGYGEPMGPNCPVILHAHRLYVADGFAQNIDSGIERLEVDLAMWRNVMGHAKTLALKMLAADVVNDDVAILSGLLAQPDLEGRLLARLGKLARPLDQMEQSLRWPMQSELKAAAKVQDMILKRDSADAVPTYVSLVSVMPLPKQKRFNLYADYYEASGKAAAEGRFAGWPKRASFVRYPAESWLDYGLNPIENILGVPPLPEWETYGGRILELDARLRLAGLQAWIRRSPQEQDLPTRMAKAGQGLYDPFTGFPMLVNRRKGLIYSVGQDGKDHDGEIGLDIAAVIPSILGGTSPDGRRSGSPAKPR